MTDLKTLKKYAEEVLTYKNSPQKLAELHLEIAAKYAMMSDIIKDLKIESAKFWDIKLFEEDGKTKRDKDLSDRYVEILWRRTEGGQKEIRLKYEMDALEKLMGAIISSSVVSAIEARGSY